MATLYTVIYDSVLPKLKDFDIPLMEENEVYEMLHEHLRPAIVSFHTCKKDLSSRNEAEGKFNDDLDDMEIEILSNYLLLSFIDSNYIRVPTVLKASLSSKDFNAFSPANFLDKLILMHNTYLKENETLLSRYSWRKQK
ncbi:hypothetical protein DS742_13975 [Lacrimispora amygdalina]|uniref:Uncharacterized protein n=1 Tax=Lacrimispora amygdalina TaxID=253257 RepID=A0A3E2NB60_9FIRM|nr:hypothetical protein [Clostridium indicum]RFZ78222.1 hypothetical protein DS742_13975 [Clostridium indicum]